MYVSVDHVPLSSCVIYKHWAMLLTTISSRGSMKTNGGGKTTWERLYFLFHGQERASSKYLLLTADNPVPCPIAQTCPLHSHLTCRVRYALRLMRHLTSNSNTNCPPLTVVHVHVGTHCVPPDIIPQKYNGVRASSGSWT